MEQKHLTLPDHTSAPYDCNRVLATRFLVFCGMLCKLMFVLLFFLFFSVCCLSVLDVRISYLQTLLVVDAWTDIHLKWVSAVPYGISLSTCYGTNTPGNLHLEISEYHWSEILSRVHIYHRLKRTINKKYCWNRCSFKDTFCWRGMFWCLLDLCDELIFLLIVKDCNAHDRPPMVIWWAKYEANMGDVE